MRRPAVSDCPRIGVPADSGAERIGVPGVADCLRIGVPGAAEMRALGARIAGLLRPGDLVVLTGPLGAGKTTLVQGIAAGLRVRGPITSPTFVIARVHPSECGGTDLVHADAYRLGSRLEVDDLDLDADVDHSVTVVEWGEGLVEDLTADHLTITIAWAPRDLGQEDRRPDDEPRVVTLEGHTGRWPAAINQLRTAADPERPSVRDGSGSPS